MNHSTESSRKCKSPDRNPLRSVVRSRDNWKRAAKALRKVAIQLRNEVRKAKAEVDRQVKLRLAASSQRRPTASVVPASAVTAPMAGHQFSAPVIAMCCSLAKAIGLRATPKALDVINAAFGLNLRIPTRDAVRNWLCRDGVAILKEARRQDDWLWLVDHSNQLGTMHVLTILGIRSCDVPPNRPLLHQDMTPLAVLPCHSKSKATVSQQLKTVALELGVPLSIHCDGASEFREAAKELESIGFQGPIIDDIKHKISSYLKRTLPKDPKFLAFEASVARFSAFIRQTELEHLLPPSKKTKCRFMNLDRMIDWALMVQSQLASADKTSRLYEKTKWIDEYAAEIEVWRECRQLVGRALEFSNEQGLYKGSTEKLTDLLKAVSAQSATAKALLQVIVQFYQANEQKLLSMSQPPHKLPCSTEVLESAFGMYKTFQRGNQRGCFTTLIASFATIFDDCTPTKIQKRFATVSNKIVAKWMADAGLTNSTHARRTQAYRKSRSRSKQPLPTTCT